MGAGRITDIFFLSTMEWRKGPKLPVDLSGGGGGGVVAAILGSDTYVPDYKETLILKIRNGMA